MHFSSIGGIALKYIKEKRSQNAQNHSLIDKQLNPNIGDTVTIPFTATFNQFDTTQVSTFLTGF